MQSKKEYAPSAENIGKEIVLVTCRMPREMREALAAEAARRTADKRGRQRTSVNDLLLEFIKTGLAASATERNAED